MVAIFLKCMRFLAIVFDNVISMPLLVFQILIINNTYLEQVFWQINQFVHRCRNKRRSSHPIPGTIINTMAFSSFDCNFLPAMARSYFHCDQMLFDTISIKVRSDHSIHAVIFMLSKTIYIKVPLINYKSCFIIFGHVRCSVGGCDRLVLKLTTPFHT